MDSREAIAERRESHYVSSKSPFSNQACGSARDASSSLSTSNAKHSSPLFCYKRARQGATSVFQRLEERLSKDIQTNKLANCEESLQKTRLSDTECCGTVEQHCAVTEPEAMPSFGTNQDASTAGGTDVKDESEPGKKKRKQSHQESANRSTSFKVDECRKLSSISYGIKMDNSVLTDRIKNLSKKCVKLMNENDAIEAELTENFGQESVADIVDDEANSSKTTASEISRQF